MCDIWKYLLSSKITIKHWFTQFLVIPGFLELNFTVLKARVNVFTDFEKDVILCFDEMKVKSDPVSYTHLDVYKRQTLHRYSLDTVDVQ